MTRRHVHGTTRRLPVAPLRRTAFSLVELLTVIFIISLLIGILIPSLSAARSAAKKAKTSSDVRAIGTALDLFRNDNEKDFPQTHGYPPSFSHPRIYGATSFDPKLGQFPFLVEAESSAPTVYGAHWLPAMLMGSDQNGYVQKGSVPRDLRDEPWRWYAPDAITEGGNPQILPRQPLYMEPGAVKLAATQNVRGRQPADRNTYFPNWDEMKTMPVMVDAFDQPILYYAANAHGRATNMVEEDHSVTDNVYTGGTQRDGPPYYFHQDNWGFTGKQDSEDAPAADEMGWDFGGGAHAIARSGHDLSPAQLMRPHNKETFARFVLDRAQLRTFEIKLQEDASAYPADSTPLKPVNVDSFLLISAGIDGRYGTADDVTNFPLSVD